MTKSRANWHAIVALLTVIGAELEGLKGETYAQLSTHTIIFWLCLLCAIGVGFGNSILSTKPSTPTPVSIPPAPISPNEKPKTDSVLPPALPGAAV